MLNLMLTLETFGPRPKGLVVAVGVVVFDDELPVGRCVLKGADNRFHGVLDAMDARDSRFETSGETMGAWTTRGAAFERLLREMRTRGERLDALFVRLQRWLSRFQDQPVRLWADTATSDVVMLENAFRTLGLVWPLPCDVERDYRTLLELAHGPAASSGAVHEQHEALSVATERARFATAALQILATSRQASAAQAGSSSGRAVASAPCEKPTAPPTGPDSAAVPTAALFLDFDGVLQTPALESWVEMEHAQAVLELLTEMPHLGVVVTATQRETSPWSEVLGLLPSAIAGRVLGATDVTTMGRAQGGRQAEIEAWLARNPHIRTWVAVDDESLLYQPGCPWLVQTHKWMGWTEETSQAVRDILAGREPQVKVMSSLGAARSMAPEAPREEQRAEQREAGTLARDAAAEAIRTTLATTRPQASEDAGLPGPARFAATNSRVSGVKVRELEPARSRGGWLDRLGRLGKRS